MHVIQCHTVLEDVNIKVLFPFFIYQTQNRFWFNTNCIWHPSPSTRIPNHIWSLEGVAQEQGYLHGNLVLLQSFFSCSGMCSKLAIVYASWSISYSRILWYRICCLQNPKRPRSQCASFFGWKIVRHSNLFLLEKGCISMFLIPGPLNIL